MENFAISSSHRATSNAPLVILVDSRGYKSIPLPVKFWQLLRKKTCW